MQIKFQLIIIAMMLTFFSSNIIIAQNNPCGIDNSIVPNAGFESVSCEPSGLHQLECADNWVQASEATSDFLFIGDTSYFPNVGTIPPPPNGSAHFVGLQAYRGADFHEYLGTCITLESGTAYTFEALIGAAGGRGAFSPGFTGELVIMGLPNCSLPLSGKDCKEDEGFTEIARIDLSIPPSQWLPNKLHLTFTPTQDYQSILIGPSCSTIERSYILLDDIFIAKGNPCSTDCCQETLNELRLIKTELLKLKKKAKEKKE